MVTAWISSGLFQDTYWPIRLGRALALAGDDPAAKQLVAGLYDEFGFDTLDLGGLDESWRVDAGQPAFVTRQNLAELQANVVKAKRRA